MDIPKYLLAGSLSAALAMSVAGCKSNQPAATNNNASTDQSQVQNPADDPANANVAPISNATQASYNAQPSSGSYYPDESGRRRDRSASDEYNDDYNNPDYYNNYDNYDQPVEYADQAPPQMPEYDQPPCPGEGYIWTPGYWDYASDGYYWVPGAWVSAPYQGALWTPGYWSYDRGRYGWHRGFWGRHVGYYGGIDYGHGYTGYGYQGGYWNGDRFDYNRSVNNVNTSQIHEFYNYQVPNQNRANRVSFNGPNGVQVKPKPAEVVAFREQHNPPMTAQLQEAKQAQQNRANFANVNHGRPQVVTAQQPLPADRNVKAPPAVPMRQPLPATNNARNGQPPRPGQPATQPAPQPRVNEPGRNTQPVAQPRASQPVAPMRPAPAPRQEQPVPQQQQHAAPVQRPQQQPAPERQVPQQHAQPAPERQGPAVQHPVQQQHAAPVEHPAAPQHAAPAPERQTAPQRQQQQRPAPAAHPQHQAAPPQRHEEPSKKPEEKKKPQQ